MIVKLLITEALKRLYSVMQVSQRLIANRKDNDDNMQMSASVIVHISSAYILPLDHVRTSSGAERGRKIKKTKKENSRENMET